MPICRRSVFSPPSTDTIVKANRGRDKILLQPYGDYATNLLELSTNDKKLLLRDLRYAPAWIAAILRRVSGSEGK